MRLHALLVITIAAVLAAASPAAAATFTVTGTGDDFDYCDSPDGGNCPSIRAALSAAYELSDPVQDVIELPADRYQLTIGPLDVRGSVALVGAGARATTIVAAPGTRAIGFTSATARLAHLTVSGGQAPDDHGLQGGNLLAQNSTVELDHVHVTGGSAFAGGGVANRNGQMTIADSLIDNNRASDGGGIVNYGGDGAPATLVLRDSTVALNHAGHAGAISSIENPLNAVGLESVTIARNAADEEYATGVGGVFFDNGTFTSRGSLIAHNVRADGSTENCGQALSSSGGNNLESGSECGFTGSGDRANAAPDLAEALADRGGETDVLAFGAASGALDIGGTCSLTDQTGAPRPQGLGCDAGAWESRTVATQPPPPPAPTPAPVATPVATPVAGKSVEAEPVSGKVLVKLPGSKGFVELDPSVIPNGSEVDTRDGVVEISRADGGTAKFYDGIFKLSQANGVTTATLSEKLDCSPASKQARAAVKKAKKTKTRKLWGEGKGKFRTRGQYSAATIRGTKWFLQDTCTSTITKVKEGVVEVRDEVKRKTIVLRKNKSYTARPKR